MAFYNPGCAAQIKEISERQHIPPRFLEQIFQDLKRAGLVMSKRGPKGGYRLSKTSGEIRLGDILRALEGPVALCPDDEVRLAEDEADGALRVTVATFLTLSNDIQACFDRVTVEALCEQGEAVGLLRGPPKRYVYSI